MKTRRFIPEPECITRIDAIALTKERETFYDSYFDSPDFAFARKNIWVRERNGIFALKKPDQYIDSEKEIMCHLGLTSSVSLKISLLKQGITQKFSFTNERIMYTCASVSVCIDIVYSLGSELFEYHLGKVIGSDLSVEEFCTLYQVPSEEADPKSVFFLKTYYPGICVL